MTYTIRKYDGSILESIADKAIGNKTPLTIYGKNTLGYGEYMAENLVHMLENFSGETEPSPALHGQFWVYKNVPENKFTLRICEVRNPSAGVYVTVWHDICSFSSNGVEITATATSARYADLAERFEASEELSVGDVVCLGGDKEIRRATVGDRVLGIISANPGFGMNSDAGDSATHPYVAYVGRIPANLVDGEEATKFDFLYLSNIPGKLTTSRTWSNVVVATALEKSSGGQVMVSYGK